MFGFKSSSSIANVVSLQPGRNCALWLMETLVLTWSDFAAAQIAAITLQSWWFPSLHVFLAFDGFSFTLTRKQGGSEALPRITNGSEGQEGNKDDWLQN